MDDDRPSCAPQLLKRQPGVIEALPVEVVVHPIDVGGPDNLRNRFRHGLEIELAFPGCAEIAFLHGHEAVEE
jgi:hypothetical protein